MKNQDKPNTHLDDLQEIRSIMERSSRFISLSGFSGVFVGLFALVGVIVAMEKYHISLVNNRFYDLTQWNGPNREELDFFFTDAILVLFASLAIAIFLSYRKANKTGLSIWNAVAKRLFANMMIPLVSGGVFCLAMLYQHLYGIIAPATLIFYGLALFSASKYTLNDIRYLGIMEIGLGLFSCFLLQYQLIFWAIGFGLLHIVYGIVLYNKYER